MTTKDKIIATVVEMLENNLGYEKITMNGIADKTGIGKSTIYEYFNSREELLIEATISLIMGYINLLIGVDLDTQDFYTSFVSQIKNLIKIATEKSSLLRVILVNHHDIDRMPEVLYKYKERFLESLFQHFKTIFDKGISEHKIIMKNPSQDTFIISSLITGAVIQYFNNPIMTEAELADLLYNNVLKLLN